ncbi:MAG: hypothetical protein P1U69_03275 [Parvibaculaceae bacterium]|nr:hypothetical protein [Parvibaculaceae bacterium]
MNISVLLDLARQKQSIRSDRQLANYLDVRGPSISAWRQGYSIPDIGHTLKLCELSKIPAEVGLAWRNAWQAEDEAKKICTQIAQRVTKKAGVSLPSEAA